MELGRFLVEAVVVGGQSPNHLARTHLKPKRQACRMSANSTAIRL